MWWRSKHWAFWFWLVFFSALFSVVAVSTSHSQETGETTTQTPTQEESQSENPQLRRSRNIANDLLTTSVTLSSVIDSWLDNSRTQEERLTRSLAEQRRLSKALDEASNTVNEQQSLLLDSWRVSESSSKSFTQYVETTEKQFKEVAQERDEEAARAHRRGIAFIIAAIIAGIEGAILIAQ